MDAAGGGAFIGRPVSSVNGEKVASAGDIARIASSLEGGEITFAFGEAPVVEEMLKRDAEAKVARKLAEEKEEAARRLDAICSGRSKETPEQRLANSIAAGQRLRNQQTE
eukprot:gene34554-30144_t